MTRLLYPGAAASAMRACLDGAPAGGRHTVQSLHGHTSQATLTHLQPVLGPGHVAEPLSHSTPDLYRQGRNKCFPYLAGQLKLFLQNLKNQKVYIVEIDICLHF